MENPLENHSTEFVATQALASLGAANWGLQEFGDMNLVTEFLGTGNASAAYAVFAAAGVVTLTEMLGLTEIVDDA